MRITSGVALVLSMMVVAPAVVPSNAAGQGIFDRLSTREVTIPAGTAASDCDGHERRIEHEPCRAARACTPVARRSPRRFHRHSGRQRAARNGHVRSAPWQGEGSFVHRRPLHDAGTEGTNERYRVDTGRISRTGKATKKQDAMKIGLPAAGGAAVGALIGGKKGALIGAGAGGGAGTAVVLSTRGAEVGIGRGAPLVLRLASPIAVRVRR